MNGLRVFSPSRVRAPSLCRKLFLLALSLAALALSLAGCGNSSDPNPKDCVSSFMSGINSTDRSGVYKSLDSDGSQYGSAKASPAAFWSADFPLSGIPYTLSGESVNGNFIDATIDSSYYTATYGGGISIVFEMGVGSDYNAFIKTITLQNAEIYD
jgi:hypothetical protein